MTGAHNLFRLYVLFVCDPPPPPQPRGMSRPMNLCLQFSIVTTTLVAGKTMTVLSRNMLTYCTAMFVYVYQTPTFPPHYGGNVKVKKTQHICQAIPPCSVASVKQWLQMTGSLFIAYDALHMKI